MKQTRPIRKLKSSVLLIFLLLFTASAVMAQDGNLILSKGELRHRFSYKQLLEYQGLFEYQNNSTITLAASPIDTVLYAIINESRYKLSAVSKDVFEDSQKNKIQFNRNKKNKIIGYTIDKHIFNIIDGNIKFPKEMWYARANAPKDFKYKYKKPSNYNDGLTVGSIDSSGLNQELLSEMVEKIVDGTYPNVHSVLIIKDGKLVFEEYFYDHHKDKRHELRSATKSFISALTGIAIEKGFIKSVDEKVLPYFHEYTFQNLTEDKQQITIENLMTNQSGLDCDVYNSKAAGDENTMAYKPDWIQYSLDLPMNDKPGNLGQYCSSNPIILGRIIEKATKMPLPTFASQTIFKDLGISNFEWRFKPDPSSAETFCQLNLTSRDFAKFGLLFQNNGVWNGKQVIEKEFVEQSLSKHSVVAGLDYGYLWWTRSLDANGVKYYGKLAQGNGGQKLYIFKELGLVTVITAGHYNMQSSSNELNAKYILPSFNKN